MQIRRIWSEMVSLEVLGTPRVVELLQRYKLQPLLAVRPPDLPGLAKLLARYGDAGLEPALWPMIEDGDGRWANARNIDHFLAFTDQVVAAAGGAPIRELAFDLEPDIERMRAPLGSLRSGDASRPGGDALFRARERLAERIHALRSAGTQSSAAVMPTVLLDGGAAPWQVLMGTPVDGLGFDHLSA